MKIILVVTGAKGKNVVFVDDELKAHSLEEAIQLAKAGKLENVYAVQKVGGVYLRSSRNVPKKVQLEQLSISSHQLFKFADDAGVALSHLAFSRYLQLQERTQVRRENLPFIAIDGIAKISKRKVRATLKAQEGLILGAAKQFAVDRYLVGAILIDEIARFAPIEDMLEKLAVFYIGKNVSAGIAQVKMETARSLIQDGYYDPDPTDPKLSRNKVKAASRGELYEYVRQPKHSIFFAAAHVRSLIDHWKKFVDLNKRPEIIATLYSIGRGKPPHSNPQPSKRGVQIAGEFYRLAQKWIR